ncbi:MAG: DUF1679 domain-containing protein [Spirochaetales bacterium]|nr:DUF1679 domain-containing protein [Spirochaetales bacterium]
MKDQFKSLLLNSVGASACYELERIQTLWSGYGSIIRIGLSGSSLKSVVVKHVKLDQGGGHPRGWNSNLSHERKIKSYRVESAWYENYSTLCDDKCRVPQCYALDSHEDEVFMVLEDLDDSGFDGRRQYVSWNEVKSCLHWLASFHGRFLNDGPAAPLPEGLWKRGTYWHLDTRPEELEVLNDSLLKAAAGEIDRILNESPYQTFLHGDAKLANFCFSPRGDVAAVDFQYVGGGCGMKDLAYFTGSCYNDRDCETREGAILDYYFSELKAAVHRYKKDIDFEKLEESWRSLYPVAWTDFHRFLKGWSPGHWKINSYSERVARETIGRISGK